jgi:hypothetical protein
MRLEGIFAAAVSLVAAAAVALSRLAETESRLARLIGQVCPLRD